MTQIFFAGSGSHLSQISPFSSGVKSCSNGNCNGVSFARLRRIVTYRAEPKEPTQFGSGSGIQNICIGRNLVHLSPISNLEIIYMYINMGPGLGTDERRLMNGGLDSLGDLFSGRGCNMSRGKIIVLITLGIVAILVAAVIALSVRTEEEYEENSRLQRQQQGGNSIA